MFGVAASLLPKQEKSAQPMSSIKTRMMFGFDRLSFEGLFLRAEDIAGRWVAPINGAEKLTQVKSMKHAVRISIFKTAFYRSTQLGVGTSPFLAHSGMGKYRREL